jgi:hypothetical protein
MVRSTFLREPICFEIRRRRIALSLKHCLTSLNLDVATFDVEESCVASKSHGLSAAAHEIDNVLDPITV